MKFFNFKQGIYYGGNARPSSPVYTGTPTYITALHNSVTHGDHRSFSFGESIEGKSLQHHPQVCTINVLEIIFGPWAYIEITRFVPFFKS